MFALEKEMTEIITKNINMISHSIKQIPKQSNIAIAYELPVKYRLIDIAVAYANKGVLPDDPKDVKSFKYLSGLLLHIMAYFYLYPDVSIHRLKSSMYMNWDEIKLHLRKLERLDLIKQISKYRFSATEWKRIWQHIGILSIELKLCDWQEALQQAEFNLLFSDYSFVAMDEHRLTDFSRVVPYFKAKNIGLLSVDNNGCVKTLVFPLRNKRYDKRVYAVQRVKLLKDIAQNQKWVIIR